jgi:predicted nucleotidyltransferase
MGILETLRKSIDEIGIKEIARRSGLAASTVSRVNSGLLSPSLEVTEKISRAAGYEISIHPISPKVALEYKPRLREVLRVLSHLRPELKKLGARHLVVFGSVARGEDREESDLDLFVDYGSEPPLARRILQVEGRIIDAFPGTKVDFVTNLSTPRGRRLKLEIEKDGRRVF